MKLFSNFPACLENMTIIRPTHLPEHCEPTPEEISQIQRDRLAAVRRELKKRDLTAAILFDPTHTST
ncbi:hypothetical protein PQQ64_30780 [Paraburkholderia graminis]|uniref:hypothetical protein n=1 Tax=Paraburkholderia graminis TaxID=60548 RepID=UPI0038BA2F22